MIRDLASLIVAGSIGIVNSVASSALLFSDPTIRRNPGMNCPSAVTSEQNYVVEKRHLTVSGSVNRVFSNICSKFSRLARSLVLATGELPHVTEATQKNICAILAFLEFMHELHDIPDVG